MLPMPNVRVTRYEDPIAVGGWLGTVEPTDRAWILFVPVDGEPRVYVRSVETDEDGVTHTTYRPQAPPLSPIPG